MITGIYNAVCSTWHQAENNMKNEFLNSNGTDQNKSFGSQIMYKAMNIRF